MAPFGGTRAALGTNPIAFGMPSSQGPVVLDMGTSAFMGTELALRERLGQLLPEECGDRSGRAIRPATRPRRGRALYCRSAAIKATGSGLSCRRWACLPARRSIPTATTVTCSSFSDPIFLVPLADFKRQVAALIDRIKSVPTAPGVAEIRIPGERAFKSRERLLRDGIEIDRLVYDALAALAD